MINHALALPQGGYVVPDNRWDLLPAGERTYPDLSVVIPYYRNRAQLDLLLEGLKLQDYPRFEVIVADDGSPEPLRLADPGLPVRVLRQEDRGFRAAAARNLAVRAAEGEVLCFLDQDTIPAPGYLSALSRVPSVLPDVLAVGRREHADLSGWAPQAVREWLRGSGPAPQRLRAPEWLERGYRGSENLLHIGSSSYEYLISAVMCCPKALFEELGGFDESFEQYGGEDWEFAYRAWNAGAVLLHEPEAVAWHDGPDWAGRSSAEERRSMKEEEERALRQRIPQESRTGPDLPANVVLTGEGTQGLAASEVQRLRDCRLNVAVRPGAENIASARYYAELHAVPSAPVDLVALLEDALSALQSSGAGQVRFEEAHLLVGTSRARRRTERWQSAFEERDLLSDLFGRVQLSAAR